MRPVSGMSECGLPLEWCSHPGHLSRSTVPSLSAFTLVLMMTHPLFAGRYALCETERTILHARTHHLHLMALNGVIDKEWLINLLGAVVCLLITAKRDTSAVQSTLNSSLMHSSVNHDFYSLSSISID